MTDCVAIESSVKKTNVKNGCVCQVVAIRSSVNDKARGCMSSGRAKRSSKIWGNVAHFDEQVEGLRIMTRSERRSTLLPLSTFQVEGSISVVSTDTVQCKAIPFSGRISVLLCQAFYSWASTAVL